MEPLTTALSDHYVTQPKPGFNQQSSDGTASLFGGPMTTFRPETQESIPVLQASEDDAF